MKNGDRIRIIGRFVYLGRWLQPGEEGTIESADHIPGRVVVKMDDGHGYVLATAEFELIK